MSSNVVGATCAVAALFLAAKSVDALNQTELPKSGDGWYTIAGSGLAGGLRVATVAFSGVVIWRAFVGNGQ